ncbi:dihydromonapterin reductase [Alteromonas facilis]|uniref:dihydromonapterin reductase n=1 Tax=Alteromonas facilis TaxID=2048004 RepID=UPI000C283BBE|nr:dihydromonapterin reductase [Alteromonas facilis]
MKSPVLITGGTQRLGLAVADHLIAQDFPVIITYRRRKPSVDALSARGAHMIEADFSTQSGIEAAIDQVKAYTTSLRAVIHNASDWDKETPESDYAALFNKMMQVHASAPYQMNLAFESLLTATDTVTDIIHMTDYVQQKGSQKHIAYAASKAALHNLTLSFASKLAPKVKVNSIAPALVMFNEHDSAEYRQSAIKKSILEICPGPQEVVKAVAYLLESDFVTGQTLHLDGGRHLK